MFNFEIRLEAISRKNSQVYCARLRLLDCDFRVAVQWSIADGGL